jgi:hypothetical protein
MDSDEVNSIGDTIEAQQVANVFKTVYNDIISNIELPDHYDLFQLDPSLDSTKPVVMSLPSEVLNIGWLEYNKATTTETYQQFSQITFLPREQFLGIVQNLISTDSDTVSYNLLVDGTNIPLLARNDKHPDYYTTFNNETVVFDSYLADVDTTLQSSKTLGYGKKSRAFLMTDNFIPALDDKHTSLLFNEAKALCFSEVKQITHSKAEKNARKGWIKSQSAKRSVPYGRSQQSDLPDYGRK